MADDWYYAQNNERKGPVPFAKLKAMAADGWLGPDDLVWRKGMSDWIPARDADGLFLDPLGRVLQKTISGLRATAESSAVELAETTSPPGIPEKTPQQRGRKPQAKPLEIQWYDIAPRHLVAASGGFLAAHGIAFTAIAQSNVAPAFTLSGLFIAAVGLYVEIGRLLGQAIDNIGKASKEAADRRLRAKELALEKQRLDLEAARMAQDYAAREDQHAPAAVLANERAEYVPAGAVAPGQVVVINHPPVQRWSPGLAAVLSFFVPGLGQVYKRQIINGIVWFFLVGMGYLALILPGMVLHFFCGLGALSGNPWTNARSEYHSTYAYRLGKSHLEMTDHYLLMAATPHKSNPGRFQRFPSLLDGDIESLKAAMASQLAPLYLRPIKEALTTFRGPETGVAHKLFRKREVRSADFKVQGAELAFYEALTYYVEDQ